MKPSSSGSDGERTRREVLGDEHVDRAQATHDRVHRAVPGLHHPLRVGRGLDAARAWTAASRSMITLAALTSLKAENEIAMHVRAALRNGLTHGGDRARCCCTPASTRACPPANAAFAIAQRVLEEE